MSRDVAGYGGRPTGKACMPWRPKPGRHRHRQCRQIFTSLAFPLPRPRQMRDPIVRLDFHVSPAPAKQQLAASNKLQAKSKKGAHLSVGPSPAWRDRDFVPLCGTPGR